MEPCFRYCSCGPLSVDTIYWIADQISANDAINEEIKRFRYITFAKTKRVYALQPEQRSGQSKNFNIRYQSIFDCLVRMRLKMVLVSGISALAVNC